MDRRDASPAEEGLDASGRPSAGKLLRKAAQGLCARQIVAQSARRQFKTNDVVATAGVPTVRPPEVRIPGVA